MAPDAPHSTPRPARYIGADLPPSDTPVTNSFQQESSYGRAEFEADARLRLQLRAAEDQLEKASEDAKLRMEAYAFLCGDEFNEKQDLGFATVKWTASRATVVVNGDKKRILEKLLKDPEYAHLVKMDFDTAAVQSVLEKNQDLLAPYGVVECLTRKYIDVRPVQPKTSK